MFSFCTPNHWELCLWWVWHTQRGRGLCFMETTWNLTTESASTLMVASISLYPPPSETALSNSELPASQWLRWMRKCLSPSHPMPEVLKGSNKSPWSAWVQTPYWKVTSAMVPNSIYHCGCHRSPPEASSGQKPVTTLFMLRSSWLSIHDLFFSVSL